jgi:hypothetical protein
MKLSLGTFNILPLPSRLGTPHFGLAFITKGALIESDEREAGDTRQQKVVMIGDCETPCRSWKGSRGRGFCCETQKRKQATGNRVSFQMRFLLFEQWRAVFHPIG